MKPKWNFVDELTDKNAAGLCSSAQNNKGVSSTIWYGIEGVHIWVKPIP